MHAHFLTKDSRGPLSDTAALLASFLLYVILLCTFPLSLGVSHIDLSFEFCNSVVFCLGFLSLHHILDSKSGPSPCLFLFLKDQSPMMLVFQFLKTIILIILSNFKIV